MPQRCGLADGARDHRKVHETKPPLRRKEALLKPNSEKCVTRYLENMLPMFLHLSQMLKSSSAVLDEYSDIYKARRSLRKD